MLRRDSIKNTNVSPCALILVESVMNDPEKVEFFVDIAKKSLTTLKSKFLGDLVAKNLMTRMMYIYEEPRDWTCIKKFGKCVGVFYNAEMVDIKLVNYWTEKLHSMLLENNFEALEALFLLVIYETSGEKMKTRDPGSFRSYMDYATALLERAAVPAKYRERMEKVFEIVKPKLGLEELQKQSEEAYKDYLRRTSAVLTQLPSTSNPSINRCFTWSLKDLTFNDEFVKQIVDNAKIKTSLDVKEFATKLYETAMAQKDFVAYVRLALLVHNEIASRRVESSETSFRVALSSKVLMNFYKSLENFVINDEDKDIIESLIKFSGELYKIRWIDVSSLIMRKKLSATDFPTFRRLEMFHLFLQIVSLSVIKFGQGEKFQSFHRSLKTKMNSFELARENLICHEVLDILETVTSLEPKRELSKTKVSAMFSTLKMETISEIAEDIKLLPIRTIDELETFVKLLIKKGTTKPDDAKLCAKLVAEIKDYSWNFSEHPEVLLAELLLDKCQELLLNNLGDGLKLCHLKETTSLLQLLAELYTVDVFGNDIINLSLNLLCDSDDEKAADCINNLLRSVGRKVDAEDSEKLNEYFDKFEEIIEEENSYRASVYENLIELRLNGWTAKKVQLKRTETVELPDQSIEGILNRMTAAEVDQTCEFVKDFVAQSEKNLDEFINALWKNILTANSEQMSCYVKLCVKMFQTSIPGVDFHGRCIEFLQCRQIAFFCIENEEFTDKVKERLGLATIFIAQLYDCGIVSDEILESWIKYKLSKQLTLSSLTQLITIIDPKINKSENSRLLALKTILDDMMTEASKDMWTTLKEDIAEIEEVVRGLHEVIKTKEK